jgi:hypothetical protein
VAGVAGRAHDVLPEHPAGAGDEQAPHRMPISLLSPTMKR